MGAFRSTFRKLVPFGSRRDRFVWIALVTVRKMREGPGPWLRAVKKGLYQLLPLSWQRRVLRWKGEDEFFRRGVVRLDGAAAGAEVPGLVSVVLPIYQQANMAAEAIDSVLAQSYEPFELIVVDDGSTDGLEDVLRRYLDDPRVRAVSGPNQGLPKALSTGFDHACGEFFTWTSADNRMLTSQLERLVAFLRARPDVQMVYADYELIDERGELLVGGEFRVMDRTDKRNLSAVRVNRSTHDLNRYEDNFIGACFLYRGQVGRLLGDYNPELGLEDYDYWMRVNRLFSIEHLGSDEVLYQYRVHDNTLSARARELRIAERAKVLMGYERERAQWCDAPTALVCDDPDAFAAVVGDEPMRARTAAATENGKVLVLASTERLATTALDTVYPIACWFDEPEQAHACHAQLRHLPVLAFGRDEATAARLAVYTRTALRGERDPATLDLAKRYAANHTFFARTHDPDGLRRTVPSPLAKPGQEPLRVLLQLDTFGKGGLERVVVDLATCLVDAGCEVDLLTLDGSAAAGADGLPDAVQVRTLTRRDPDGYEALLREHGWHAVHAHASTFGADVAARLSVPFVQVVHNSYVWFDRELVERYRAADAHTAAYACVSAQALGYADLRLGLDVRKMLVIENGVDAAIAPADRDRPSRLRRELGFDDGAFVFLQVASVQPQKAHVHAVRAFARLHGHAPHARLLCLGNDQMHPVHAARVRGEARRLGVEHAIVFAGHRGASDVAAAYALADAFFLPSFWEGCSLSVWEAIRHDLPLVLSDVGAAREQIAHGRGVLVAPPFDSMFELDAGNLDALVADEHTAFVERLADALASVLDGAPGTGGTHGAGLPHAADRRTMARRHLLLLRWLLQGGAVPGMRESIARAAEPGSCG